LRLLELILHASMRAPASSGIADQQFAGSALHGTVAADRCRHGCHHGQAGEPIIWLGAGVESAPAKIAVTSHRRSCLEQEFP
jgi:hypothetical protein